jgi:cytochrome c biogenesis protein CcmG/thiol:disulfide interchange protein DsbE
MRVMGDRLVIGETGPPPMLKWVALGVGLLLSAAVGGLAVGLVLHNLSRTPGPNLGGLAVGQRAPDFSVPALDGSAVRLSDHRGRLVLVHLWSPDCEACRVEMPTMKQLSSAMGPSIDFISISIADRDRTASYVADQKIAFPVAVDDNGQVFRQYRAQATPVTYLIGTGGLVLEVWMGVSTLEEFQQGIHRCTAKLCTVA